MFSCLGNDYFRERKIKIILVTFAAVILVTLGPLCASAKSSKYDIYLINGKVLQNYSLYKSKNISEILVAVKGDKRYEISKDKIERYEKTGNQTSSKYISKKYNIRKVVPPASYKGSRRECTAYCDNKVGSSAMLCNHYASTQGNKAGIECRDLNDLAFKKCKAICDKI